MPNPLLTIEQFPDYDAIKPEHALPAIEHLCKDGKKQIEDLLNNAAANWETYEKLQDIDDRLGKAWSPVAHLHAVMNNDDWRAAYAACQPLISQYSAELSQHSGLYKFYCQLRDGADFADYDSAQKKLLHDAIRDFELSGVDLSDDKKAEYQQLSQSAAKLYTTFSNNVLDATQAFHLHFADSSRLVGIPESALALYKQLAQQQDVDGYWLTLDLPSYLPAMTYADDRDLRETLYHAYVTRASEVGPQAGEFDNTPIIAAIMALRSDIAELLNFANYADLSLANKMADSPQQVINFLDDLVAKSRTQAQAEFAELQDYAAEHLGLPELQAWDIAYASEKLKQAQYSISQEQLRDYFPVNKVLEGLFAIVERLFAVSFAENAEFSRWHEDVTAFTVYSEGKPIAYFYMDLYARQGKNGGAWMNGAVDKITRTGKRQLPIAYLVGNFIPPTDGQPAYLSHDEVVTLFHEFGHGLHHMLTEVNYSPIAGINGVEWDAVELPSQFMENFCFERQVLTGMSCHRSSGEALPDDLFDKLTRSKNYHAALMMLRQLEFSLFDIKIHAANCQTIADVMDTLKSVRAYVAVTPSPDYARFPMSFSHIFAGGYAAGYFSYKWAEVLSADAFSRFEEEGVYNASVGNAFKQEVLALGASRTAMENFTAFRGREPTIDALLRHNGIVASNNA